VTPLPRCDRAAARASAVAGTGFSLAECLAALFLFTFVLAMALPVLTAGAALVRTQPEVSDLDQQLRVASASIRRALDEAGAGTLPGALSSQFAGLVPAVFPSALRVGGGDAPDVALPDRITLLSIRRTGWDVDLVTPMSSANALLQFATGPPCRIGDGECEFRTGEIALAFDRVGRFDAFRIRAVAPGLLDHDPLSHAYSPADAARVAPVTVRVFRFDAGRRQLRTGGGLGPEAPLLDDVEAFECRYFGVATPPLEPRPPLGSVSCLFDASGASRLAALAASAGDLVELPIDALADGPFCAETGGRRYDADLLRIRRMVVRLVIRPAVQSTPATGVAGALSTLGNQREVIIDVTPRNLDSLH
jgi:hypothetical protein